MNTSLYREATYNIRGAIFAVHKELGCGFLERVYQDALEYEFRERGIPYEREKEIQVSYKGHPLGEPYRADFVCYGKIIVELKAVKELEDIHRAQVLNYLKASGMKLGLLVNFGEKFIYPERLILERYY
jgi:GxxExxY protein